ncbi:MEDS domain-containing protein [Nocardia sp. NPDC088792]|uniref:MEDS domain-containing protein n=1 Tax=Nocardia sp. NPDC088792 TaxID=3364332 RepID=UPI0037FD3A71
MEVAEPAVEPHDHVVNVYDAERDLVEDVSSFLAEGLAADGAVVVIATAPHRDALARGLVERGIDLHDAVVGGRYHSLDAVETLASFTVDGMLNRDRFFEVIGGVLAVAGAGDRPVRAFGEMVALLWAEGQVPEAIELEALWNELAHHHRFSLYCAYPAEILTGVDDLAFVQQVCTHHSAVVPPRSYVAEADPGDLPESEVDAETYLPVPVAVSAARRFVTDRLRSWGRSARVIDDAALVVSELAANAVVHAHTVFRVSLAQSDSTVKITTEDLSAAQPVLGSRDRTSPGGRGMLLINALSSRWGAEAGAQGKSIWSEISFAAEQEED